MVCILVWQVDEGRGDPLELLAEACQRISASSSSSVKAASLSRSERPACSDQSPSTSHCLVTTSTATTTTTTTTNSARLEQHRAPTPTTAHHVDTGVDTQGAYRFLRPLRFLRCVRCVRCVGWKSRFGLSSHRHECESGLAFLRVVCHSYKLHRHEWSVRGHLYKHITQRVSIDNLQ